MFLFIVNTGLLLLLLIHGLVVQVRSFYQQLCKRELSYLRSCLNKHIFQLCLQEWLRRQSCTSYCDSQPVAWRSSDPASSWRCTICCVWSHSMHSAVPSWTLRTSCPSTVVASNATTPGSRTHKECALVNLLAVSLTHTKYGAVSRVVSNQEFRGKTRNYTWILEIYRKFS